MKYGFLLAAGERCNSVWIVMRRAIYTEVSVSSRTEGGAERRVELRDLPPRSGDWRTMEL